MSKLKVSAIHDPDNDNEALTIDSSGNVSFSGTVTGAGLSTPTITSISGSFYEGNSGTLTVNGTNLLGGFAITITHNSIDYTTSATGTSSTTLPFDIPASLISVASVGDTLTIKVTNAEGEDSNTSTSTVKGLPTGGTETDSGGYRYHTFTSSGTFTVPTGFTTTIEYLMVAGGGGSGTTTSTGAGFSGGGGAGGMLSGSQSFPAKAYTVAIGSGGTVASYSDGNPGGNTSVTDLTTAVGGGGGGCGYDPQPNVGKPGGSGGGAGYMQYQYAPGGAGTTGQGNPGGDNTGNWGGAGGGGKGSSGGNAVANGGSGAGGSGQAWNGTTYASGGDGGNISNSPGGANTGDGGDAYDRGPPGNPGGSGIAIFRYQL